MENISIYFRNRKEKNTLPTPEEVRHMEHMHTKMSYNQITDYIYAGNNLCCQTHFEMGLLSKGISADISLESERLDNPQGVKYFFWFPWEEDTAPGRDLIDLAMNVLDDTVTSGVKVYISPVKYERLNSTN